MKAFYFKELSESPLYLQGKAYRFELMETSDEQLIRLLDSCAKQHKGGIIKITEDEYSRKKLAKASTPSLPRRFEREEVKQKSMPASPRFVNQSRKGNAVVKNKPPTDPSPAPVVDATVFTPVPVKGILS